MKKKTHNFSSPFTPEYELVEHQLLDVICYYFGIARLSFADFDHDVRIIWNKFCNDKHSSVESNLKLWFDKKNKRKPKAKSVDKKIKKVMKDTKKVVKEEKALLKMDKKHDKVIAKAKKKVKKKS